MRLIHKLVIVVSIPILLIWIVAWYATRASEHSLLASIEKSSSDDARSLMSEIDRSLHNKLSIWRAFSTNDAFQDLLSQSNRKYEAIEDRETYIDKLDAEWLAADTDNPTPRMHELLDTSVSRNLRTLSSLLTELHRHRVYGEIFLTNEYGVTIAMTGITTDFRQNDEKWWLNAWRDGIYVADVHHDKSAGIDSIDICIRVDDSEGNGLGVLKAALNIQDIIGVVQERTMSKTVMLFSADHRIVKSSSVRRDLYADGSEYFTGVDLKNASSATQIIWRKDVMTDERMLYAYARSRGYANFKGLGWSVLIKNRADSVLQPVKTLRRNISLMALAATLLALLSSGSLAVLLTRRIGKIVDATHKISRGNLNDRVDVTGTDELSDLAESFNSMTDELENYAIRQRRTNSQLRTARDEAQSANHAKDEFLANMSHEIRTPMNAIVGMTEFLLNSNVDGEQRRYLSIIMESGDSLMNIINEILDFSKIGSGKLRLETGQVNLRECLGDSLKILSIRAHNKALELVCDVDEEIPEVVIADATRLKQIVVNLVGNAIKFTKSGEVILAARCINVQNGKARLTISIRDTGIGIDAEKLDTIFEPFEQADGSTTRRFGGTGLGLTISHQLVEMMGGELKVTSVPDQGSEFEFTIECPVGEDPHDSRTNSSDPAHDNAGTNENHSLLADKRVLLVEDHDLTREILARMIQGMGTTPTTATSGEQAIALLNEAASNGNAFDLLVIDLRLPDCDGTTVLEEVRNNSATPQPRTITLCTAEASEKFAPADSLNISATLVKPVKRSELREVVRQAILEDSSSQSSTPAHSSVTGLPDIRPLKVLLAEDGVANQVLGTSLLERWGHTVQIAENGRLALEAATSDSFDLILMDVEMPELDGMDATRAIRKHEQQDAENPRHVPIVAMTARAMQGDREKCLASGMDAYVSKPFRQRELYAAIQPFFVDESAAPPESSTAQYTTQNRDDKQTSTNTSVSSETVADTPGRNDVLPDLLDETPDLDVTINMVAGDHESVDRLIDAFVDEAPDLMQNIEDGISAKDRKQIARAAHTLKSTLRIFGLPHSIELAESLEKKSSEVDPEQLRESMEHLRQQIDRVVEALKAAKTQ